MGIEWGWWWWWRRRRRSTFVLYMKEVVNDTSMSANSTIADLRQCSPCRFLGTNYTAISFFPENNVPKPHGSSSCFLTFSTSSECLSSFHNFSQWLSMCPHLLSIFIVAIAPPLFLWSNAAGLADPVRTLPGGTRLWCGGATLGGGRTKKTSKRRADHAEICWTSWVKIWCIYVFVYIYTYIHTYIRAFINGSTLAGWLFCW